MFINVLFTNCSSKSLHNIILGVWIWMNEGVSSRTSNMFIAYNLRCFDGHYISLNLKLSFNLRFKNIINNKF